MNGGATKKPTRKKSVNQEDFNLLNRVPRAKKAPQKVEDAQKIFKYIDDNVIGKGLLFLGPYGRRKIIYADYATSGRSLQFIEDYVNKEVLPSFGDPQCTSTVTGLQSYLFNTESESIIRKSVNASDDDEVVFCNNPSDCLANIVFNSHKSSTNESDASVTLFVSQLEPAANIRAWIDRGAQIERISINRDGFIDLVDLETKLKKYPSACNKLVGLFPGVSRLTAILSDDVATTILLHQYNAISIWDYSAFASSAPLNVNPALPGSPKDALFYDCNKMIGGMQASGVLIVKKSLANNFHANKNEIVGQVSVIRCALVAQLKETLASHIMMRNEKICKQMLSHVRNIPEIILLCSTSITARRISSMAFMIKHPRGIFLHHRFVVAILNDVFGIQSTANNLIHETLGINSQLQVEYEKVLGSDGSNESLRPGFVRITLPYFMNEAEINYILESLKMVATEAWKLLPQYIVDERTGEWRHHSNFLAKERKALHLIRFTMEGKMVYNDRRISAPGGFPQNFADCLKTARNLFSRARKLAQRATIDELYLKLPSEVAENLRWYMLPHESHELLLGHFQNVKNSIPFDPNKAFEPPSFINNLLYQRTNSLSALDVKRYQKSLLNSSQNAASAISVDTSSVKSQTPPPLSPIVRFSLGDEVKCGITSFSTSPSSSLKQSHFPAHLHPLANRSRSYSENEQSIDAYVKEMTQKITKEIKSEIREVISQVEDVLEHPETTLDLQSVIINLTSAEDLHRDAVSTGDVVEYLKEFSKDLTSEVTTEIREAAIAVEEFISPDNFAIRNDKKAQKLF